MPNGSNELPEVLDLVAFQWKLASGGLTRACEHLAVGFNGLKTFKRELDTLIGVAIGRKDGFQDFSMFNHAFCGCTFHVPGTKTGDVLYST